MTESTEVYDVYEVALGHLYLFKKSMTSGEFKGATAGSSRMRYKTDAGQRFVLAKRK